MHPVLLADEALDGPVQCSLRILILVFPEQFEWKRFPRRAVDLPRASCWAKQRAKEGVFPVELFMLWAEVI